MGTRLEFQLTFRFSNILNLTLFVNLPGNSYIPLLLLISLVAKEKLQNIKYQDIMTSFSEIDNFLFLVDTFIYLKIFFNLLRDCYIRN